MFVLVGNPAPVTIHHEDEAAKRGVAGDTWNQQYVRAAVDDDDASTIFVFPEGLSRREALNELARALDWHTDGSPLWVAASDPRLAEDVADEHDAEVREVTDPRVQDQLVRHLPPHDGDDVVTDATLTAGGIVVQSASAKKG